MILNLSNSRKKSLKDKSRLRRDSDPCHTLGAGTFGGLFFPMGEYDHNFD